MPGLVSVGWRLDRLTDPETGMAFALVHNRLLSLLAYPTRQALSASTT